MSALDLFFDLGNRVTKGDSCRKALFDYCLYWIVFLSFISIAISYYYSFFFKNAAISTFIWGLVITIFCWFNYWALSAFRGVYNNMKDAKEIMARIPDKKDTPEDMMKEFENGKPTNKI